MSPMFARHARLYAGHPRLTLSVLPKTWMAGTSPAMTWRVSRLLDTFPSVHHLPDLHRDVLRQFERVTHQRVELLAGAGIDHQVAFLGGGEEIRILQHRGEGRAQCGEPLRRHAGRGQDR